jgi:hypothetical protein
MKFAIPVQLAVLLLCGTLLGQPTSLATQPGTFHVRGTIKDPLAGVIPGVKVTFHSELLTTRVTTNNAGVYEADLPLGDYTMTAQGPRGFSLYRRPLFRVTSQSTVVLNATLLVAATDTCGCEQLIPIPSGDGLPFIMEVARQSAAPTLTLARRPASMRLPYSWRTTCSLCKRIRSLMMWRSEQSRRVEMSSR